MFRAVEVRAPVRAFWHVLGWYLGDAVASDLA
jgi:hypothetical protein